MSIKNMRYGENGSKTVVETYQGAVFCVRERNYHDDSDFYAVVWDAAAGCLKDIEYASTRYYSYEDTANVDATPEARAAACAWWREQQRPHIVNHFDAENARPVVGCLVKVVAGRKVKRGETATVLRTALVEPFGTFYRNGYKRYAKVLRLLLKLDSTGEEVWTNASNCERTDAPSVDMQLVESMLKRITPENVGDVYAAHGAALAHMAFV